MEISENYHLNNVFWVPRNEAHGKYFYEFLLAGILHVGKRD